MPILKTQRAKHIRHQDLRKRRKSNGSFRRWLDAEVTRLGASARAIRDRLAELGDLTASDITAAADLDAAGVVRSTITATFAVGTQLAGAPDLQVGARLTGASSVTYAAPGGGDTIVIAGADWTAAGIDFAGQKVRILDEGNANHELIVTVASATATDLTLVEDGVLTAGTSSAPTIAAFEVRNSIERDAGDFTVDGYLANDHVTVATGGDTDGRYEISAPGTTVMLLVGDEPLNGTPGTTLAAVAATGFETDHTISRGAGDFTTDGFADGDLVRVTGAVNAENDRDWPIKDAAASALTVAGRGVTAEVATANVVVEVIQAEGRQSGPALD